jgi:hypothetical protein
VLFCSETGSRFTGFDDVLSDRSDSLSVKDDEAGTDVVASGCGISTNEPNME